MSAVADIRAALAAAPSLEAGHERTLLVGTGAMNAICADIAELRDAKHLKLDGVRIDRTGMFDGWTIMDWDAAGSRWIER